MSMLWGKTLDGFLTASQLEIANYVLAAIANTAGGGGSGQFNFGPQIFYASPIGTNNNVTPQGYVAGVPQRIEVGLSLGATTWTGFAPGIDGTPLVIHNPLGNSPYVLMLNVLDSGSLPAYQFSASAGPIAVFPGQSKLFCYYGSQQWVLIGS